ncbi:hypothetical protein B0H67DRAFT_284319 [Lasiosphaeris hirsuta]|uniref:Uncharacterized protein n=1 Tax=Lasiosphaeris hirsuta TaxID=260670 RepID=A0AA40DQ00_9PEZI|nr:hypothetical protein B0H67DRAFT_284319 [Lasiosphaeris hirsuta]
MGSFYFAEELGLDVLFSLLFWFAKFYQIKPSDLIRSRGPRTPRIICSLLYPSGLFGLGARRQESFPIFFIGNHVTKIISREERLEYLVFSLAAPSGLTLGTGQKTMTEAGSRPAQKFWKRNKSLSKHRDMSCKVTEPSIAGGCKYAGLLRLCHSLSWIAPGDVYAESLLPDSPHSPPPPPFPFAFPSQIVSLPALMSRWHMELQRLPGLEVATVQARIGQ